MPERYAIVLSTFNGAAWLDAQLASIRAQSAADWRLYARDDGSRDGSDELLRAAATGDARIELLSKGDGNLGAAASFGVALQHALERGERHVFLCDQDDVWQPEKCARMLAVMTAREAEVGGEVPMLVHCDLAVVGEDLTPIHPSFAVQQGFPASEDDHAVRLLLGNTVTGCAALANAALLRCALPLPRVAMHDWWLAQCAAAFGEVHYLNEALVLYRQHGANIVGARARPARAATIVRSPRAWWLASARRFLQGLHQLWVIRSRARARSLAIVPGVREPLEVLSDGLAAGRGAFARLGAAVRSGALPRAFSLRLLLLSRVALLPLLRARLGDEHEGAGEPECA